MLNRVLFLFFLFLPIFAQGRLQIPQGLSVIDRQEALRILGLGTNFKTLGNPYPLGGYLGIEASLSYEMLPTSPLSRLGSGASEQSQTVASNVTLGKGLFYDVDVFLTFVPSGLGEGISGFGGGVRWGAYEMQSLPVNFSLQVGSAFTSFQNKINTTTHSLDVLGGWNFQDVVLFAGAGLLRSSGLFIGGADGVTDTQETLIENVSSLHGFIGVSIHYSGYFLALQHDRAVDAVTSIKVGIRQ